MAIRLIEDTVGQHVPLGPFISEIDGKTRLTGLTIANTDIKLWKPGATTLVDKNSGGATHMANGVYYATLDDVDTSSTGPLVIFVHPAGALPVMRECEVKPKWHWIELNFWRNVVFFIAGGTPTTTTIPIASVDYSDVGLQTTDGAYVGMNLLKLYTGLSVHRVTNYVGATKVLTIDPPLPTAPSAGTAFMLLPGAPGVLADGAITAAKIAANAIDADSLAGDAVTELQSGLATSSAVQAIHNFLDNEIASILADTNELQTDWTNGGRLDLLLDAVKTKTDTIPASPAAVGSAMTLADGAITAAKVATGAIDADALAADAVDEILDEVVEGSITLRQALRLMLAALVGKASGGGTSTVIYRDMADTKNRVTLTTDINGNRTAVTRDAA